MPQTIEVPGHGMVEFPDGMTDDQIVSAIQANTPSSTPPQPQDQSPQWMQSLANNPGVQEILGAGDAAQNFGANLLNLAIKPVSEVGHAMGLPRAAEIPLAKSSEGMPYDLGNIGGQIASYAIPMGATTRALMAAKSLPGIGSAASALLGNSLGGAIGKNAIASAGYGALMNPDSRGQSAIIEGALGGAGGALGHGISKLMPSNLFKTNISPEKLLENIDVSRGTNTPLGDIINSPDLKFQYENVLSKILGGGVPDSMQKTTAQITGRGNELLGQILGDNNPAGVKTALQEALKKSYSDALEQSHNNYSQVDELANKMGVVIGRDNLANKAQELLKKVNKSAELSRKIQKTSPELIDDLQFYANPENTNTLDSTNIFRGSLGDTARESSQKGKKFEAGLYKDLKNALTKDIEDAIPLDANNPLRQKYDEAQNFYRNTVVPFEEPEIAKFTRRGGDPDLILSSFLKAGQNDRGELVSKLLQNIPQSKKGLVPYGFFSKAIEDGELNPLKLRTLYKSLGPTQKEALFSQPGLAKSMADYSKLIGMNTSALNSMVNVNNGQRTLSLLVPAAISHAAGALGGYELGGTPGSIAGGLAGLGGAAMISKALVKRLTSEKTREKFVQKMLQNKVSTVKGGDLTAAIATVLGQQFQ